MGRTELRCHRIFREAALVMIVAGTALGESSESACASCHSAQTMHQAETPMAQAMLLPGENPVFKVHPKLTVRKGSYTYTIETRDGNTLYTVSDDLNTVSLPIRWTIGKRMQTWVLERDGHYLESLVSYYPNSDRIDLTVGDEGFTPHSIDEAIGRPLSLKEANDCFGCHSTRAVIDGKLSLDSLRAGITCEHCHQKANTHGFDAIQGVFDSSPPDLKRLSAEGVNDFCGQCHRTWETVIRTGIRGVPNVRFQPYRLENSKCFDGSDRRLTCIACHDPHKNLIRDASVYDKVCVACHRSNANRASLQPAKHCPKAAAKCVSCHMPRIEVNSPGGLLTFTDHQIRITKSPETYPN